MMDYKKAAEDLGAEEKAVKAVASVESNGSGFFVSKTEGKVPKVQYEPYQMYRAIKFRDGLPAAEAAVRKWPDLVRKQADSYQSLDRENSDMDLAAKLIDRQLALESSSWGAFQIMGYHWATCGYKSLQEFINEMYSDVGQLRVFVRFIKADPVLVKALRDKDWKAFARKYNGPGYAKNQYDTKMEKAYKS